MKGDHEEIDGRTRHHCFQQGYERGSRDGALAMFWIMLIAGIFASAVLFSTGCQTVTTEPGDPEIWRPAKPLNPPEAY